MLIFVGVLRGSLDRGGCLSLTLSLLVARLVAVCVISRSLCVCRVSCVDMAMEEKLLEQDVLVEASNNFGRLDRYYFEPANAPGRGYGV